MDRVYVMELVRSFQVGNISRRDFLRRAGVAAGGLAAANSLLAACAQFPNESAPPVVDQSQAQPAPGLSTADGLTAGIVEYPDTDGETLMGYAAYPAAGQGPGLVVIQEWWGLNDHIKDVARRFAAEGFVALAPDLYHGVATTEPDEARKLAMALSGEEAVKEIGQAVAWLKSQENVGPDKIGVVGFCMGGGLVLQTAAQNDAVDAGVVFYGRPLDAEQAAQVNAPILTFIGTQDNIPLDAVQAMHAAFDSAGLENQLQIYDGAQHAFFNDTRAGSYDPDAAADAWPRALDWFRTHLAG